MALTVTAEPLAGKALQISLDTDAVAYTSAITIYRNVNGIIFPVRGFTGLQPGSGVITGWDVDFPQNTAFTYETRQLENPALTVETSAGTAGIDFGADWILGTDTYTYGTNIHVVEMGDVVRPGKSEVIRVLRRRDAIIVTDRRWGEEFDLTLATLNLARRQVVEDILERHPVITFSPRYPALYGFDVAWHVGVGDVTEQRVSRLGYQPERLWSFRCTKVIAPAVPRIQTLSDDWINPAFWAAGGYGLD